MWAGLDPPDPAAPSPGSAHRPQLDGTTGGQGRGAPPPARGRSPSPNSPSGWKPLDTRNGEHMMSGVGAERAPLCQPHSRQAGQTLRPDAMEKETTAQAGPGPLPSYSSKRAGGQGVIKGGLSLPRASRQDENAPRCSTRPTGNLRFRAGDGTRGARACSQMVLTPSPDGSNQTSREGAGRWGYHISNPFYGWVS